MKDKVIDNMENCLSYKEFAINEKQYILVYEESNVQ